MTPNDANRPRADGALAPSPRRPGLTQRQPASRRGHAATITDRRVKGIGCPVLGADHALEPRLEATVKSRFGLLLTRGFQADGDFRRFLSPDVTYLEHNVPCRGGNYKQDIALLCTLKLHNIDKRLFWSEWHPICQ